MQKRELLEIAIIITILMCLFTSQVTAERKAWDCPDCGRTGNTGNYCGGCAHPAPWIESSIEPSQTNTSTDDSHSPSVTVRDIITFGTYPQTAEGKDQTPIKWIVLDYDETNHKALLISKYGLDAVPYNNTPRTDSTWEKCTLRIWLNGEFLNKAFSMEEQSAILTTAVNNSTDQGYSGWDTDGGNDTQDQIFLLSYAEAKRYFGVKYWMEDDGSNMASRVAPTAYAVARGAHNIDGEPVRWWWLRSPGDFQDRAAGVNDDGSLRSNYVYDDRRTVRPAFWLNLESDLF